MKDKSYWAILLNPVFLILYFVGMKVLYQLCNIGGVRRRMPVLLAAGGIGLLWIIIWTFFYLLKKKQSGQNFLSAEHSFVARYAAVILGVELVILFCLTGVFGYKIYKSAVSFNGKLSWYLEEKQSSRKVTLRHNNFLESGVDGILEDLDRKLNLPEELFVVNKFQVDVTADGTIISIYAFLYGKSEDGRMESYLIDYDAEKEDKMTVWLDGNANANANAKYAGQDRLQPMQEIINAFLQSDLRAEWSHNKEEGGTSYTVTYKGYESAECSTNCFYLGDAGQFEEYRSGGYGMPLDGFLVTISANDRTFMMLASDIDTMDTKKEIEEQEQKEKEEQTVHQNGELIVDEEGGMHFYLNPSTVMSLTVVDAALGSRAYAFTGKGVHNDDPFMGNIGVAEGIYFLDEQCGFILLSGASADHSEMYDTQDGGANFIRSEVPVQEGSSDLSGNQYDFTAQDFDYIGVPYEENGVLLVKVSPSEADLNSVFMLFSSMDGGKTWEYQSLTD